MIPMKLRVQSITVGAIAVLLVLGGGRSDTAFAQFDPGDRGTPGDLEPGGTRAVEFTPPNRGTPDALEPGGTRARSPFDAPFPLDGSISGTRGCSITSDDPLAFVALTPNTPESIGVTTEDYPTVYAYIPATAGPVEVEFILSDKDYNTLYKIGFPIDSEGEIMGFQFPRSVNLPQLYAREPYLWSLTLICDPFDPAANPFVEGWIGRFPTTDRFESELVASSAIAKASLYANAGIWYEALHTLAQLRQQNPGDATVEQQWENLLRSVELEEYINTPLMESDY